MGNYGITGWSGGSRQSLTYNLKAGQFRGMGRVNVYPSRTTIINNNIIGGGIYADHHCCDSGTPKWMNWLGPIGLGTTFLGWILNACGIGGGGGTVEGAGGRVEEEPKNEPSENEKKLEKKLNELTAKAEQQAKEIAAIKAASQALHAAEEPAKENTEVTEPQTEDLKDGTVVRVHDQKLGSKADISGIVTKNADGSINIKDQINTYTYKQESTKITYNGKEYPVYTLTGAVNNLTGKEQPITRQQYILINGQLVQPSDLNLDGLGTGSVKHTTPTAGNGQKGQTITGQNGYSATQKSDGTWEYRDNKGQIIPPEKFEKNCPNIYKQTKADTIKSKIENSSDFKKSGGKDVRITQNSDGSFTATFKIAGGERTISGKALEEFIEG